MSYQGIPYQNLFAGQGNTTVCFDLSGFKYMGQIQLLQYQTAWNTFNQVQSYNSNVSTLRGSGDSQYQNLAYYQFYSQQERATYTTGQALHEQRYPQSNWRSIANN